MTGSDIFFLNVMDKQVKQIMVLIVSFWSKIKQKYWIF